MADWYELDDLDREELIGEVEGLREELKEQVRINRNLFKDYEERSAQLREAEALVAYLEKKLLCGNYYV